MLSESPNTGVLTPSSLSVNTSSTYTCCVNFPCGEGELHDQIQSTFSKSRKNYTHSKKQQ